MCLYTKQVKPKTLTRDTVFYKVLYLCNNEYYTPFTESKVAISEDIFAEGEGILIPKRATATGRYNQIRDGYIHLLREKQDAEEMKKRLICLIVPVEKMKVDDVIVVRAIAPAGTEYYSGINGPNYGSVAVKKVKYELI